jgi:WD40 repeat protein
MNSCASPQVLSQLLDGTLSPEQMMDIREHLAGCLACQAALDHLSEKTALRQWASACRCLLPQPADEPDLARLLEKLAATPPAGPCLSGDTADYGPLDGPLSFLAPPQQEGDLGRLGPYRVLAELGRGGMGIVLLAYDPELQRTVALKVLPPDRADERARARFVREARAAAGITHDNVVPVYAVAAPSDGPPYLVMQYVDGPTLRERIKAEGRLDPHEAARICAQAAEGLAAAHRAGLVHRDIKPANIILDRAQERARIMDFGLARATALPGGITQAGTVLGTPEYMSPEQVLEPERVDGRTDVYGLGVTLYEALTGEVPFRGVSHMVLQQIVSDDPRPPRRLNDKVPRDLETICLKCLHKEPAKRYTDAAALAEDLKRFLAGQPIQARPVGRSERLWRWCRRNPLVASLAAALFLALAGGLAGATSQWLRAEAKAKQLEISLYYNRIALADREIAAHNLGRAEELLQECPESLRGWEWHYLKRRLQVAPVTLPFGLRISSGKGFDLAFSPDGRFLAMPGQGKNITVWDGSTGTTRIFEGHSAPVLRLAFSPDGRFLLSSSDDRSVRLWEKETGKEVRRFEGHHRPVHGVAWNPDGRRLASASFDQTVKLWDATTGDVLFTFPASFTRNVLVTLAFSADGRLLAAPGVDHTVTVWDVATGRDVATLHGHTDQVFSATFSPDGRRLVTAGWEGSVKVWDLTTGERELRTPRFTVDDLSHAPWSVALSADGRRLALAGSSVDATVRVYDVLSGENVFTFRGHSARVVSVAFSPDGRRLVSGSTDKTVRLWDTETGQEVLTLRDHTDLVGHVRFDPSGQRLASASDDGTALVWDATPPEDDRRIRTLRGHAGVVYSVAFSPDGQHLASAGGDQTVRIWEATTGREILALHGHRGPVNSVAFSLDGRLLASASEDKTVKLWDAQTCVAVFTLPDFPGGVRCVAFSPDGRHLATSDAAESVQVWDSATGRALFRPLRGHAGYVNFVTFSHDGKLLATSSVDGTVRLWDATTGQEIQEPYRSTTRIMSMALSPASGLLASGDADQTVTVRETATRCELFRGREHTNYVIAMAFSRDGRRLASASWQEVLVWDLSTGRKIQTLRGLAGTIKGVAFSPDGQYLAACGGYKTKGEIKIWDQTLWGKQADQ